MSSYDRSTTESSRSMPSFSLDDAEHEKTIQKEFADAKSFLMECGDTNDSLWTHLSELLKKITEERPTNIVDYFEEYSRRLKEERFATVNSHIRDIYEPPKNLENVKKKINLLKSLGAVPDEEVAAEVPPAGEGEENPVAAPKVGFLEQMNFFREAGVCLSIEECYSINIALRKLSETAPVKSVRFWGKILGLKKNYIVAECELTEEETSKRVEEQVAEEEKAAEEAAKAAEEKEAEEQRKLEEAKELAEAKAAAAEAEAAEIARQVEAGEIPPPPPPSIRETYKMPPEPKPVEKVEVVVPRERYNEGVNKKVYYICNEPGDEWVVLPNLLPQHIVVARKIKKYFTGELDKVIVSYPDFNGTEMEYLRAQIARISAGTQISPLGYYTFHEPGEEEEEVGEEEEEAKSTYVENPEFEPLPMKDLTDPTMAFWVHHTQHILKQGRTKWWSANPPKSEEEEAEGGEEEEEAEGIKEEPEIGPPLLTPLSEDVSLETTKPWTVRNTSVYTPENAIAFVLSNLWPGAYAFATGKIYGNIYIGWGHKYSGHGFSPAPFPFPEEQYEVGPEIMEIEDPTPEAEEEWRLAHEKKPPKSEEEEGEEEEEQEGDEEED